MTPRQVQAQPTDGRAATVVTPQRRRRRLVSWRFRRNATAAMGLSVLQQRHVTQVNQRIASGEYRIGYDTCCCGTAGGDVVAQVDRYGIALDTVICPACATLRFDPYLSAESLSDFYRNQYQDMYARVPDPDTYFARQKAYGQRLLQLAARQLRPGAVVAEVGCGAGGALAVFKEAGFEVFGCDYSARLIEYGRAAGMPDLCAGDIDELTRKMQAQDRRADLIFLHHVFEHLASPQAWLERAQGLLADDGMVVVAVPDIAGIEDFASPDGDLRLFLHIAHKFNFTFQGLVALAGRVGMKASPLNVEPGTQAPELWIAFTRSELRSELAASPAWQGTSESMFARLQQIERRFLRRAVARKLAKWLRHGAQALANVLPGRSHPS